MTELSQVSPQEALEPKNSPHIALPLGAELFYSNDPRFVEQAAARRELHTSLEQVFEAIPDVNMDIKDAMQAELIDASTVNDLYNGISDLIEQDENNTRLLLYLPFELLPDMTDDNISTDIAESANRFSSLYRDSWIRLLHEVEPRASFVDGDVLEPGLPDVEEISKAGHLIPEILAKGLISVNDVIILMDIIKDPKIIKPMAEGATVARDMGLIKDTDWAQITMPDFPLGPIKYDEALFEKVSPERKMWLQSVAEEKELDAEADKIALKIQQEGFQEIVIDDETSESNLKIALNGIFKGGKYANEYYPLLKGLLETSTPVIRDIVISGVSRWAHGGIIDGNYVHSLDIDVPDLSSPIYMNKDRIAENYKIISTAVQHIQEDPILSAALYPTFLVFGSRMQGYATSNSDYDAAIFFRPKTMSENRDRILEHLYEIQPELRNIGTFREYWVDEDNDKLNFRVMDDNYRAVDLRQSHFFFNGAWISQNNEYRQILEDILGEYVDLSRFGDKKDAMRSSFIGRIELGMLQYRLMHKGFSRFYPSQRKEGTQNANLIDWESDFWDPGYRRIATKLFVSRVFLPDLS